MAVIQCTWQYYASGNYHVKSNLYSYADNNSNQNSNVVNNNSNTTTTINTTTITTNYYYSVLITLTINVQ